MHAAACRLATAAAAGEGLHVGEAGRDGMGKSVCRGKSVRTCGEGIARAEGGVSDASEPVQMECACGGGREGWVSQSLCRGKCACGRGREGWDR